MLANIFLIHGVFGLSTRPSSQFLLTLLMSYAKCLNDRTLSLQAPFHEEGGHVWCASPSGSPAWADGRVEQAAASSVSPPYRGKTMRVHIATFPESHIM
jgi:hypothetical protein